MPKIIMRRDSMTPEEILARAQKARWRFRAIIRLVMQNIYWLEDVEDQTLGDDVQKNILLLTRRKEKKSLLSLQDKAILNKPAEYRTDSEKQHLSRIIGGLKCFRRYPSHVKSQLAGVTYFFYFGPGRTIVRQGDESHSLYFVITGEVTVSQETFDPVLKRMMKQDIAVMGPGNMFGEVALLHDIPRTATICSNTHVELLCLKKKDFDVILKATVQQQWNEIQRAMSSFTYFEDWDEIAVRECCILSKMKIYYPDQTIFGDGIGLRDFVYFVLKGRCRIIEHLLVTSEIRGDTKMYKLYEPPPSTDTTSSNKMEENLSSISTDTKKTQPESKSQLIEDGRGESLETKLTAQLISGKTESKSKLSIKVSNLSAKKSEPHATADSTNTAATRHQSQSTLGSGLMNLNQSKPAPRMSNINLPPYVETHFMQVCILNPTACFGVGENMNHRRVVATTFTECLLIPRYWLIQRNTGNIWNRVQQFLNSHIPTTKQVFKIFVNQRKWMLYRRKLFNDILAKRKMCNNNNLTNVPYHIRINEQINLD